MSRGGALALLLCLAGRACALRLPALASVLINSVSANNVLLPELFDSRLHWFGCGLSVLDQARALVPSRDG